MIRNFLFHRVNPKRDSLWDPMDPILFEKSIKHIKNKYDILTFEELVGSERLHSTHKIATIMFDDGYKDNIEYAAPILDKYNVKASFYVVTDCIDNNTPTWTHVLEYSFQFTTASKLDLDFSFLPEEFKNFRFNNLNERLICVKKIKPYLKKLKHEERKKILKQIVEQLKIEEYPKLMMNWGDLLELKDRGHYIGSHTVSHSMLGTNNDNKEVLDELILSGQIIKKNLGYFPDTISYPVGSYNSKTKELAKEAGYKIGLAVNQRLYNPKEQDLYEVSRIELYNENWFKTKMRISNKLEDIKNLIGYRK